MKRVLLYIPVVLSILVLGAHFLRYGSEIGVFAALLLIALLFLRRPWVARLMQAVLVLGTLEWLRTMDRDRTGTRPAWPALRAHAGHPRRGRRGHFVLGAVVPVQDVEGGLWDRKGGLSNETC